MLIISARCHSYTHKFIVQKKKRDKTDYCVTFEYLDEAAHENSISC